MEGFVSPKAEPLVKPTPDSNHVLVVGGGVTGLVTSWVLLDHGYKVTIMSKQWASYTRAQRITSQIAGALWEFPPAVCGQHTDPISLHHSKKWSMMAYKIWDTIAADPDLSRLSGVRMKNSAFFFPWRVEEDEEQYKKMLEIEATEVRGFQHTSSLIEHYGVNPEYGCVDAYELIAPIIDTDRAMTWLMGLTKSKGAQFVTDAIEGDIYDSEIQLRRRFGADVIINATGLAGLQVAQDQSCYPIRGGLIRVINDGVDFPKVDAALSISADAKHSSHTANQIVFIVPRSDRILLLGGISQPHHWDLDLTLKSPEIRRMKDRCEDFLPVLKKARMDEEYPLAQGLRPFRGCNVRVERELRMQKAFSYDDDSETNGVVNGGGGAFAPSRIVHSYGHGGAGWSLSFGCAKDVLKLVQETLAGLPPRPMAME